MTALLARLDSPSGAAAGIAPTAAHAAARAVALPVRRMSLAQAIATQPKFIEQWKRFAQSSHRAPVELHPQLVLSSDGDPEQRERQQALFTAGTDGRLKQLAVLAPKRVKLPVAPGLKLRSELHGLRLVGGGALTGDDDSQLDAFLDSLLRTPLESGRSIDCLLLEDLETDSPFWSRATQSTELRTLELASPQPRWRLQFDQSADDYWNRFSSKTRYNFRRSKRLFDHTTTVVRSADQVDQFLRDAAVVSRQSWQGKRIGPRIRTDAASVRQFERTAELGALRCYLLRQGPTPVAFAVGVQWNGRYVLEEIGFDAAYANASPGTILLLELLDDLFACQTPDELDFGFGDGAYKQMFGNRRSESGSLLLVNRRLRPTLAVGLHRAGRACERAARRALEAGGWADRVRRWYRR